MKRKFCQKIPDRHVQSFKRHSGTAHGHVFQSVSKTDNDFTVLYVEIDFRIVDSYDQWYYSSRRGLSTSNDTLFICVLTIPKDVNSALGGVSKHLKSGFFRFCTRYPSQQRLKFLRAVSTTTQTTYITRPRIY